MQPEQRRLGKPARQRLIESVIERRRVGTQQELGAALAAAGCVVTQPTLSRDLRELGVEKVRNGLGLPRYLLPGGARPPEPRATLASILARHGRRLSAAGNIVVIRTEPGTAGAIARAVDRAEHPLVVGTLAGDDTCLVIAPDTAAAAELARELS